MLEKVVNIDGFCEDGHETVSEWDGMGAVDVILSQESEESIFCCGGLGAQVLNFCLGHGA